MPINPVRFGEIIRHQERKKITLPLPQVSPIYHPGIHVEGRLPGFGFYDANAYNSMTVFSISYMPYKGVIVVNHAVEPGTVDPDTKTPLDVRAGKNSSPAYTRLIAEMPPHLKANLLAEANLIQAQNRG